MDLVKKERLIAREFTGKTPWFMITWWAINLSVWFSLWPLTLTGQIPLYLTFLISLICNPNDNFGDFTNFINSFL